MAHRMHRFARVRARAIVVASLLALLIGAPASLAADTESREAANLRHEAATLDYQALDLSRRLQYSRDRFEAVNEARDALMGQLVARLVARYQQGDGAQPIALLLGSRSVEDAVGVLRVSRQVTSFEAGLLREVDRAADEVYLERQQSTRLERELVATQRRADTLRTRAAGIEARRRARVERARARRKAARNARSVLVGGGAIDGLAAQSISTGFVGAMPLAGIVDASAVTAMSIDAYLYSKGSPMSGQGVFIISSAQQWGVDPRLIVAIAGAESSFGKLLCGSFNAWGWSCPGSPAEFGSWPQAIATIAEGLRRYYLDEGRGTVALIQQKWAPSGAANDPRGLNNHWVANVSRFLLELGGSPNSLAMGPSLSSSVLDATSGFGSG